MGSAIYPSLAGKRVVITGGGSGIGAGLVEAFVNQEADVHFIDILKDDAQALVDRLDGKPTFHECDLTDLDALAAVFRQLAPVDVLVNNAANDDRHALMDITPDYWDNRIAVNLRHVLFATQAVAPGMKSRGGGAVINFGSISWHLGLENLALYETSKAGIEGMTRALARELGEDNIRVNCVVPGNVKTPRQSKWYSPEGEAEIVEAQALKTRIQPHHVASMVLFLASDDGAVCTGHNYWVDAGWG
ncbi:SDR family NAD(P)-dependent oxidoreductase [Aidingimonas halophila]|uniref:D-xylose dehydrogenase n=1 Tax=Aidingimonas halophila TaxID=574349 RepID=A0A1H3FT52_9GAMM|nr:SDR family oxidoreductase [Aidingimonas halophila]GHC38328.1 D-xylose 1-dehydrogenase [Aidingimonas halophila]SDX93309.1 D-xylose dehydrogenase [Aidingimonas halophila]